MGNRREVKQVIVMRTDLGMRKGKMIAQGAHASMSFLTRQGYFNLGNFINDDLMNYKEAEQWMREGFTKICVKINSEREMMELYTKAQAKGLCVHLITDAGFTEFNGVPTKTCIAIGPNKVEDIDEITGDLVLL